MLQKDTRISFSCASWMCNRYRTVAQNLVQRWGRRWWWRRWRMGEGEWDTESRAHTAAWLSGRPLRDWHDELGENRAKALEMQSEPEHIGMRLRSFVSGHNFLFLTPTSFRFIHVVEHSGSFSCSVLRDFLLRFQGIQTSSKYAMLLWLCNVNVVASRFRGMALTGMANQ